MPNWCHNTLIVSGDPEKVAAYAEHVRDEPRMVPNDDKQLRQRMLEHAPPERVQKMRHDLRFIPDEVPYEGQPLTFETDVPMPSELLDGEGWYGWRLNNWGTKWDASFDRPFMAMGSDDSDVDVSVETKGAVQGPGKVFYKFDTAWSPPVPWLEATAAKHPELTFSLRFAEVGNGFAGELTYIDGELAGEAELEVEDVLTPQEMWF